MSKVIKLFVPIDGAAVMPDMKFIDKEMIKLPTMNYDYKWFFQHDGVGLASKDRKEWVIALSILHQGEEQSAHEFASHLKKLEEEL